MRTTVRIDEGLLREAKLQAARRGTTLTAIIEDALRESLARQHHVQQREPVRLVTFGGQGLHPGVDLDDSAALLDLMEESSDPD
jgi:hypothetical protein